MKDMPHSWTLARGTPNRLLSTRVIQLDLIKNMGRQSLVTERLVRRFGKSLSKKMFCKNLGER